MARSSLRISAACHPRVQGSTIIVASSLKATTVSKGLSDRQICAAPLNAPPSQAARCSFYTCDPTRPSLGTLSEKTVRQRGDRGEIKVARLLKLGDKAQEKN